jgi:hypothetical protein
VPHRVNELIVCPIVIAECPTDIENAFLVQLLYLFDVVGWDEIGVFVVN